MIKSVRGIVAASAMFAAALFSGGASAQFGPTQVPLTAAIVEAFIASVPEVQATGEGLSDQFDGQFDDENPAASWQALLAVGGAQGALNAVCQSYGFQGFQDWLQVFTSVAITYAFVQEGGDVNAEMAGSIAEIQNNPSFTDAQKQMMIQQLQMAQGMMSAMMPSQENIDAVTPYAAELAVLFDDM